MRDAIPTHYAGQRFRSRLEATWAVFFDHLHWPWLYEPFDLDGYIPDFVLRFPAPLLVEVKPEVSVEALRQYTGKVEGSGWAGEALLVGVGPLEPDGSDDHLACGLLAERGEDREAAWWCWEPGLLGIENPVRACLWHSVQSYRCRTGHKFLGADDEQRCWKHSDPQADRFRLLWRQAQNETQWRGWQLGGTP